MNRTLTLTLLCLLCAGCQPVSERDKSLKPTEVNFKWRIIEIDSCQYIENMYSNSVPLTHKGNCNNPIHNK